jgi:hypothetical protein
MLQVMLFYSNSTNTYNTWLQDILKTENFILNEYITSIFKFSKDKFDNDNLTYPNLRIYNLYFIEFLLWKLYYENAKGNEHFKQFSNDYLNKLIQKISNNKDLFSNFKFKQLNSREHLFSQDHAIKYNVEPEVYNGIGNLCLISTSQNSAASNQNPFDKKKQFQIQIHNGISSLKQLIMFEGFENDKWEEKQILAHKKEVEELLKFYF